MTPAAEHRLYLTDRSAWARHVAPRWKAILEAEPPERKAITWAMACPALKTELRRLSGHGAARSTDPITSHEAAACVTQSGTRADHVTRIARAVREHPGSTSAELALYASLERHEAARRTADAEHQGLIRKGLPRTCSVGGRAAVTWWPNLTDVRERQ